MYNFDKQNVIIRNLLNIHHLSYWIFLWTIRYIYLCVYIQSGDITNITQGYDIYSRASFVEKSVKKMYHHLFGPSLWNLIESEQCKMGVGMIIFVHWIDGVAQTAVSPVQ